ncbi:Transcriptional antiterminator [Selenomonas sp. GACV-9]|uniref:BglG family transcription antiterminator n=1 Tax=Selenomonas sp. GACV-9 TaxID=3158782 RepID=UPI0008E823E7|nr:Transcriptional antiterminator [Selenomonas ruminantium]
MENNERRRRLGKALAGTSRDLPITINQLAKLLQVSVRTVHYDLKEIEGELAEQGMVLCRQPRRGMWLESADCTGSTHVEQHILGRKERQDRIILALLGEQKCSIDGLAEMLDISRTTLLADLKDVQEILEKRNLVYDSKRGLGIWAHGDEQACRDMLIHIFNRASYDFRGHFDFDGPCPAGQELFRDYVQDLPVEQIAHFFLELMERRGLLENDSSANRMICALLVQFKRLQQGHDMSYQAPLGFLSDEGEQLKRLAGEIAQSLDELQRGFRQPGEMQYLVRELLHSRIFFLSGDDRRRQPKDVNVEAVDLARRFIEYAQVWLGDFYLDDDELLYNLALHLQPAIERAHFGIMLTNPLLGSIKEQYASLYDIANRAAAKITEHMGIAFSEDEIGYLTIHLGAAVERRNLQRKKQLSVLLVCGNGIGTANLLAMTLRNNLPYIQIVKTVSLYRLSEEDMAHVDIIISTVDIQKVPPGMAVLRVSPILTDAGIQVIEGQIRYFYHKKYMTEPLPGQALTKERGLVELLREDLICLDGQAADWEDAVTQAGNLLLADGAVTEHYVRQMVRVVRNIGPYIVVCDGVAMPHAHIEDGAHKVAVSFLRLKEPVLFSDDQRPVDMLFAFSTTSEKAHLPLLSDLWRVFNSESMLRSLHTCADAAAMRHQLQQFLQKA